MKILGSWTGGRPHARDTRELVRARAGFTLVEALIATALLGFSLVVMFGFHTQAVRSNMHARKMTDCTYLAQLQMERLIALPWSEGDRPGELADLDEDGSSSDKWTYLPHPSGGPSAVNSYNQEDDDGADNAKVIYDKKYIEVYFSTRPVI